MPIDDTKETAKARAARCAADISGRIKALPGRFLVLRDSPDEKVGAIHIPQAHAGRKSSSTIVLCGDGVDPMFAPMTRVVVGTGYRAEVDVCDWSLEIASADDILVLIID